MSQDTTSFCALCASVANPSKKQSDTTRAVPLTLFSLFSTLYSVPFAPSRPHPRQPASATRRWALAPGLVFTSYIFPNPRLTIPPGNSAAVRLCSSPPAPNSPSNSSVPFHPQKSGNPSAAPRPARHSDASRCSSAHRLAPPKSARKTCRPSGHSPQSFAPLHPAPGTRSLANRVSLAEASAPSRSPAQSRSPRMRPPRSAGWPVPAHPLAPQSASASPDPSLGRVSSFQLPSRPPWSTSADCSLNLSSRRHSERSEKSLCPLCLSHRSRPDYSASLLSPSLARSLPNFLPA